MSSPLKPFYKPTYFLYKHLVLGLPVIYILFIGIAALAKNNCGPFGCYGPQSIIFLLINAPALVFEAFVLHTNISSIENNELISTLVRIFTESILFWAIIGLLIDTILTKKRAGGKSGS